MPALLGWLLLMQVTANVQTMKRADMCFHACVFVSCSSEDERNANAAGNGVVGAAYLSERDAAKAAKRAAAMDKFNNQIRQLDEQVG